MGWVTVLRENTDKYLGTRLTGIDDYYWHKPLLLEIAVLSFAAQDRAKVVITIFVLVFLAVLFDGGRGMIGKVVVLGDSGSGPSTLLEGS